MSLSKENKVMIDGQTYYGGLNQPPKFVKVNVDCWEKIFDYLLLRDILSMSQTCQRMRQIGGYYFCENLHGTKCWLNADESLLIETWYGPVKIDRDDFLRFVDTVCIQRDLKNLKHYSSMDLLGSVTTLRLECIDLNANAIGNFERSVLDNIETVELFICKIYDDFDGHLFASCSKLECLKIDGLFYTSNTTENSLLQYTYSTLKHFEYTGCYEPGLVFTSFLERNSSIKFLRINAEYLFEIGINTSTVQLDCLSVDVDEVDVEAIELANRLKTLHANGFYKKLHLKLKDSNSNETLINEMRSFGALEVLETYEDFYANICHLTGLKELNLIGLPDHEVDLEAIAMNLTKLERLWIRGAVDHLIPFLRNSKALKWTILDDEFEANPLNLFDLNRVRQMGGSQHKVLIGVCEDQYLVTQWKSKNVEYDLVEVTRVETISKHFFL